MNKFSNKYIDYQDLTIKKPLIDSDSKLYYKWGNIGYTILLNSECCVNKKLFDIKDDCFNIEKLIKQSEFTPATHYIINYLLPHLNELTKEEIDLLYKYQKIGDGPLYKQLESIRIPNIFIDLFIYAPENDENINEHLIL